MMAYFRIIKVLEGLPYFYDKLFRFSCERMLIKS